MTVGGIGGQKLHVGAVCSRAAAVTGGTGVAGGPKGSVQGSSSHFLRLFKVVRERGYYTAALEEGVALSSFISAHGREREHFGHMHMR